MDFPSIAEQSDRPYISTGHLPEPEMVQWLVSNGRRRFKSNGDGDNSQVYQALARVPRELFGICVVCVTDWDQVDRDAQTRRGEAHPTGRRVT